MANDIGNITASLKLESAAFIREMTKASQATATSTSNMARSFASLDARIATAGRNIRNTILGFASIAGVRAFVNLGKSAITAADEIASAAKRMGVSAEDLQRLRFAADQADVSMEELSGAFRIFQKQIATGKFFAEGDNIIEQFVNFIGLLERTPPGAKRMELALAGAGKSAGAAIGLAVDGTANLIKNMDSAVVVSDKFIAKGDDLDDKMAAVGQAISAGFSTGVLSSFGTELDTSKQKMEALSAATAITTKAIITGFGLGAVAVKGLVELLTLADQNIREFEGSATKPIPAIPWWGAAPGAGAGGAGGAGGAAPGTGAAGPTDLAKQAADAAREAAAAEREYNRERERGLALVEQTFSPMERYNALMAEAATLHLNDAEMARVQQAAQLELASTWIDSVGQITGTLAGAFQDNKAFAIADAVVNVAAGIAAALKLPFPLNWAQAAAVAAAGIAQINTIKNAKPGSASSPSVHGGKGKGASSGGGGTASTQGQITIQMPNGQSRFTTQEVSGLIDQINDAQRDGAKLLVRPGAEQLR